MKKILTLSAGLITLLMFLRSEISAQALNGTYTVPGSYATLAAAISALNTNGISGSVTIKVAAGATETAPVGGYSLTTTGTSSNHITIQKNGSGANPLLTAYTGGTATCNTNGAYLDGIFRLIGVSYVTINGIDVQENALNTTTATQMEFGYGMFKASAIKGCQNNIIENCKITLNNANFVTTAPGQVAAGCMGILMSNSTNAAPNTALAITSTAGANSNNQILKNTITNVFEGIWVEGYNNASPYTYFDQGNIIGRNGSGNNISNFGGGTSALITYGIYLSSQNNDSIGGDTINNTANGGIAHTNSLYGIYQLNSTNSNAYFGYNNINLTQGSIASAWYGIYTTISGTGNTYFINNTFTSSGGGTGTYASIYSTGLPNTFTANNNIQLSSSVATTNNAFFINTIGGNTGVTINYNRILSFAKTGVGNTLYGYYNTSNAATSGTEVMTYNSFSNLSTTGATGTVPIYSTTTDNQVKNISYDTIVGCSGGTSNTYLIEVDNLGTGSVVNSNYINNNSSAGTIYCIYSVNTSTSEGVVTFANNYINNITSSAVSGATYGIDNANTSPTLVRIVQNTIKNFTPTGTTSPTNTGIYGIGGPDYAIDSNTISNFSATAAGTTVNNYGIYCLGGYAVSTITGNSVSIFGGNGTTNSNYGIYTQCNVVGGTTNVYNNSASNFTGGAITCNNYGIRIVAGLSSTTTNVYSNSITSMSATGITNTNYGVFGNAGASGSYTNVYKNKVWHFTASATTVNNYGIYLTEGAVGSNPTNIYNDTIYGLTGSATGATCGIYNIGSISGGSTTNIYNDTISGLTAGANAYGIYQATSANNNASQVYNNKINNLSSIGSNANNYQYGIYFKAGSGNSNVFQNTITNLSGTGGTTNNTRGIYAQTNVAGDTMTIYSNTISNLSSSSTTDNNDGILIGAGLASTIIKVYGNSIKSLSGSGTTNTNYGIYATAGSTGSATSIYMNAVSTFSGTATTVNNYGVYMLGGANGSLATNIYSNNINNISGNNTSEGIYTASNTAGGSTTNIYNDTLSNISGGGLTIGVAQTAASVNNTAIYNNNIYNLSSSKITGLTYGIQVNTGPSNTIYNNFISDLRASVSNTSNAVIGIYCSGGTAANVYYNTVYLNASSSGTAFGSSALAFVGTVALDLRNNILSNTSGYTGAGITAALLRTTTGVLGTPPATTNYAATSNSNALYVPASAGNYYIYADKTTAPVNKYINGCGATGFSGYLAFMGSGRDTISLVELPPFINTSSTPYNLRLFTNIGTRVESGANNVGIITTDIDGNVRQGNGGYSGLGTAPDIGASEYDGSNNTSASINWVGGFSSNWNANVNWCPYMPKSGDNVTIASGYTYAPIILNSNTGNCHNLTINLGTTVTLNTGSTLALYGNLTNGGTFNGSNGTLNVKGSAAQTIPSGITVNNLTLNNSNGLTVSPSGTVTVNNQLTLTSGNITVDTLYITNTATSAITGYQTNPSLGAYSTSNYIIGSLKRAVAGSGQYDFPIGSGTQYELMSLVLNSLVGTSTLKIQFSTTNGGCTSPNPDSVSVSGTKIQTLLDGGHWLVTPNAEPTGGTYSAYLNERGYSAYPGDPAQMTIIKRSSCLSTWKAPGTHSNATQYFALNTAHLEQTGFTSFSDFGAGWGDFALPVKLLSFEAVANSSNTVHTNWVVATQENNSQFNVQRSADGIHFTTFGSLKGCGNCDKVLDYNLDDKEPLSGLSYYRLQMVDASGNYTYSSIKEVNFNNTTLAQMTLSPNPNNGNFSLDIVKTGSISNAHIQVLNMYGQIVDEQTVSLNSNGSHILYSNKDINTGIYFVKVIVGSQTLVTKVSIQK